jgi:integrase
MGKTYPSLKNYIQYWRINSCKHYIFTAVKGRMTTNYLRQIIKIIGKKTVMIWIYPHFFRHYAATNML